MWHARALADWVFCWPPGPASCGILTSAPIYIKLYIYKTCNVRVGPLMAYPNAHAYVANTVSARGEHGRSSPGGLRERAETHALQAQRPPWYERAYATTATRALKYEALQVRLQ